MKVIALGTGTSQGIPMIGCKCEVCLSTDFQDNRLRSSLYVESSEIKVLIDIGPDFRTQFLKNKIDSIDAVLITHEHNDHVIGLDDIRAINFTQKKSIPIYAEERVATQLKDRFSYAFNSKILGLPKVDLIHIDDDTEIILNDIKINPIRIMHGRLPILAYRLNDLSYVTDASYIDDKGIAALSNSKVLIINALRKDLHPTHYNLDQAIEMIKILKPEKAYITHISHAMGMTKDWSKLLPDNVFPLIDSMQFNI